MNRDGNAEQVIAEALHADDCGCADGVDPWYISTAQVAVAALRKAGLLAEGEIQYLDRKRGATFIIEEGELQPGEATHWRRLSRWIPVSEETQNASE